MTQTTLPLTLDVDPATLQRGPARDEGIETLYTRYWNDLVRVCEEMREIRQRMVAQGYSADFSDREAELLYLLVRETQPEVVVEISPCHGYSTNYLLAALTHNGKGKLYSFEIQAEVNGCPIGEVLDRNLSPHVDRSRFELRVGDVMTAASIPPCDFLFLDSCHEASFAAWYCATLLETARSIMVHDVLVFDPACDALVPKAAFLGIGEQYYLLESLAMNRQPCWSVAEFAQRMDPGLKARLPVRYPDAGERSIVFQGHPQSPLARRLHAAQASVDELRALGQRGFRDTVLKRLDELVHGDVPLFIQLQAVACLPQMGYRYPMFPQVFPRLAIDYRALTVSELVVLLELALTSCNRKFLREVVAQAHSSRIGAGTFRHLTTNYLRMAGRSRWTERLAAIPKRLLARA